MYNCGKMMLRLIPFTCSRGCFFLLLTHHHGRVPASTRSAGVGKGSSTQSSAFKSHGTGKIIMQPRTLFFVVLTLAPLLVCSPSPRHQPTTARVAARATNYLSCQQIHLIVFPIFHREHHNYLVMMMMMMIMVAQLHTNECYLQVRTVAVDGETGAKITRSCFRINAVGCIMCFGGSCG